MTRTITHITPSTTALFERSMALGLNREVDSDELEAMRIAAQQPGSQAELDVREGLLNFLHAHTPHPD